MGDDTIRPDEFSADGPPLQGVHGKIFPLPGDTCPVFPDEFARGLGAWIGDVQIMRGPDGDLYYTTTCGDGQTHRIVPS